ncbi:hypothetical protein B0H14DRAFT_1604008 [Mycena olivaceomarginata]|nr:hypothetical protein B0H14DRAFT_1604008 [Mycena olivaceomarginata]
MSQSSSETFSHSSSTYPSSFDLGTSGGGGRLELMNTVDEREIRARSTIADPSSGLCSFHYVVGEGGGELLKVWFMGRVLREVGAGTDPRMRCFYVGFPLASAPQVYMGHMRSLEVLNAILDREEEEGYTVVRAWVEGDQVLVNVSAFTEPHGAGITEGSLLSFEATFHRHDHRYDIGVQREYFIHAHVAEVIRIDDPRAFTQKEPLEEGLRYNPNKHVLFSK